MNAILYEGYAPTRIIHTVLLKCGFAKTAKTENGLTRYPLMSGFTTQKEAKSAARKLEQEVENGTYVKETKMTFEAFAQDWIKVYAQNVKISSVRARSKEMKHFISVWGPYQLNKITKQNYQRRLVELSVQVQPELCKRYSCLWEDDF
jgi:hypothetical protein